MTTPLIHRYTDVPAPHDLALKPDSGDEHPLLTVMAGDVVGALYRHILRDLDGRLVITYEVRIDGVTRPGGLAAIETTDADRLADLANVASVLAKELAVVG